MRNAKTYAAPSVTRNRHTASRTDRSARRRLYKPRIRLLLKRGDELEHPGHRPAARHRFIGSLMVRMPAITCGVIPPDVGADLEPRDGKGGVLDGGEDA